MAVVVETVLFDTAVGWCALAWHQDGIVGACLPQADRAALDERWGKMFPEGHRTAVMPAAADEVRRHLAGEASAMEALVIDYAGVPELYARVYRAARAIPAGTTRTYGELAASIGCPGAARAVGQALGKNPFAPVVPCHRILAAGAKMGGFSAHGGLATKQRLLAIEGAWPLGDTTVALF